ncbi:MAG: HlyD family efflux transporter periplasmic adaptor subunit [Lachnospiraceae bacterium]|nr:HlyD family efflux transporter periplasmic adaptor subunit [Lachnospiraceae bacterium]
MAKKKIKVLPVRRLNIVHLIFIFFFIYMVIMVGRYVAKEDIKVCEVTEGSLTQNHNYTGLILRTETLVSAKEDGYIKCYAGDGDRISKNGVLFALDKTGSDVQNSGSGTQSSISKEQYRSLRKYLNHFGTAYSGQNYTDVYSFKDQLTTVLYGIEQQEAGEQGEKSKLQLQESDVSGVVYFTMDGLENLSADKVTRKSLENITLSGSRVLSGDFVKAKSPVCKVISDEEWSILIPITDVDAKYYADKTSAKVILTDIDAEVTAGIEVYEDADGKKLAKLVLNDYMSSYAADRLISFQLAKPVVSGLKVPKTSVVNNELFVIPVSYGRKSESSNEVKFYRKKEGSSEREVITPAISYVDNKFYYIDDPGVQEGDMILKVKTDGTVQGNGYPIKERETLKGIYNVNKGYAIFEVVDILDENDSYCIVKGGTVYGLAVYDHIVLNASTVDEDDLLY